MKANADDGSAHYRIEFESSGTLLRARVCGTSSFAATIAYWREVADEVRARKPAALLLVDELQGPPLTAEEWQSLVDATRQQGLEAVRIAHVKPLGLQSAEHCEIHAREVGLEARVVDNETNARLWLRYGGA